MSEKREDSHIPSDKVAEHHREPKDGAASEPGKKSVENEQHSDKRRCVESDDIATAFQCCLM